MAEDDNESELTEDHSGSAMIALLPVTDDWCSIQLPHLTLVYVGEIKNLKPTDFNELGKDASMLALLTKPITLKVMGTEVFGGRGYDEEVDVFLLQPTLELLAMRKTVEQWNGSEYPFRPHVTIGPVGSAARLVDKPMYIAFRRIMVAWGKDSLVFPLNNH